MSFHELPFVPAHIAACETEEAERGNEQLCRDIKLR